MGQYCFAGWCLSSSVMQPAGRKGTVLAVGPAVCWVRDGRRACSTVTFRSGNTLLYNSYVAFVSCL